MLEIQNRNSPIGQGIFMENHFFTNSPNPPSSHPFDARLIQAEELFYEIFSLKFGEKARTKRGSGFRTTSDPHYSHTSQHSIGKARDCNWTDQTVEKEIVAILCHDFATQGPIFQAMFDMGFRGFGRYETFVHIDTRDNPTGSGSYLGQQYNKWSKRPQYSNDAQLHQAFFSEYPQALDVLGKKKPNTGRIQANFFSDAVQYIAGGLQSFSPTKEDGYKHIDRKQQVLSIVATIFLIMAFYWSFQNINKLT